MKKWRGAIPRYGKKENRKKKNPDRIFTFDIETTSLFHYPDGWKCFRPKLSPDAYTELSKAAVPYIWMFGFETADGFTVRYGREFSQVREVLEKLHKKNRKTVIWVHNLGYEMQFLMDLIIDAGWTISGVLARSARHPIKFFIEELNIEFRCSYMLTGLSLARSAAEYAHTSRKLVNGLKYTVPRSPLTNLTKTELEYCRLDVVALGEVIQYYREKYGNLYRIPYTLTGELRKEIKARLPFHEKLWIARHTPKLKMFVLLSSAFQGGVSRANYFFSGKIIHDVSSGDIASSYPTVLCAYKYPVNTWSYVDSDTAELLDPEKWGVLFHVKLYGVKSKRMNRYLMWSKYISRCPAVDATLDNGRIIECDWIEISVTNIDWAIIKECYDFKKVEYIECYKSRLDYLPREILDHILELYENKTSLKGIKDKEDLYRKSKSMINSYYGCCAQSPLSNNTEFINNKWHTIPLTDAFIEGELEKKRKSRSNCFLYAVGVWCTAYARKRLFQDVVLKIDTPPEGLDFSAIYYDTDSCKARESGSFREAREASNRDIDIRLKVMCDHYGFDFERTRPKDRDGILHPLGYWELEGKNAAKGEPEYSEFKTLGSKRYAYRLQSDGGVYITIAGVNSKYGRKALHNDLRNFKKNMVFDYNHSGKQTAVYKDDQETFTFRDIDGNLYTSHQRHGIILMGAEYNLTIEPMYQEIWGTIGNEE